jgi:pimeloyl-ACP methyl ester carboxylesterase
MAAMDVIVGGLHITGLDAGKGPVALLLHGWNSDHKTVLSLQPELKGYRILAPDLPGFGGSQPPHEVWGIDEYVKFIMEFLSKVKAEKVGVVIGHSFGGRIAVQLVGNGTLKPDKLILLGSHGLPEKRGLSSILIGFAANIGQVLPSKWRGAIGRRWRSEDYRLATGIMGPILIKVISQDATEASKGIKSKTLLIYGTDDRTTPPEMGKRFNDLIADSQLQLVEHAGHYVHLDQSEQVNKLVKEFLK